MPEKPPSPAPTTDLAGALGDALGRRADGQPDLAALVVPLLRSGAGAALIGSLLGSSSNSSRPAASTVTGPAADPHPLEEAPARHGGAGSPLAAILPPVTTATTAPRAEAGTGTAAARLAMLLAQGLPKR